jgi:hypothetical protein
MKFYFVSTMLGIMVVQTSVFASNTEEEGQVIRASSPRGQSPIRQEESVPPDQAHVQPKAGSIEEFVVLVNTYNKLLDQVFTEEEGQVIRASSPRGKSPIRQEESIQPDQAHVQPKAGSIEEFVVLVNTYNKLLDQVSINIEEQDKEDRNAQATSEKI